MKPNLLFILKKYTNGLMHYIYPDICASCHVLLPEGMNQLCLPCEENLRYTYFEKYNETQAVDELFHGRVKVESTFSLLYFTKKSNTQHIVHEIKYLNNKRLAVLMGEKMGSKLRIKWEANSMPDVLIPVPLHPKKLHQRGYNQSDLLAKGIEHVLKIPVENNVLIRTTHTSTQTKKGKYDRWGNVAEIFEVKNETSWKNKHLCIVDDVITTGSTIESCVRVLHQSIEGVKVSVISLAMAKR